MDTPTQSPRRDRGRAYRGVPPEQRRRRRRERLIAAGIRVFGTVGYRDATIRAICREASLTERYFYESFDDRSHLFSAVYEHVAEHVRAEVVAALEHAPADPHSQAYAGLHAYFAILQHAPQMARVMLVEYIGASDKMNERARETATEFGRIVRERLEQGYDPQGIGACNLDLLTSGLIGAISCIGMQWVTGGYRQSLETVVTNAMVFCTALDRQVLSDSQKRL